MWQEHKLAKLDSKVCYASKKWRNNSTSGIFTIGLNKRKPVIMVLDLQQQLRSLIRAFVTIHLSDSVSKLAASEILSSS